MLAWFIYPCRRHRFVGPMKLVVDAYISVHTLNRHSIEEGNPETRQYELDTDLDPACPKL